MGHGDQNPNCQDIRFTLIDPNTGIPVTDNEFQGYVSHVTNYRYRTFCFMTCNSGGIMDELADPNSTMISTSCLCGETCYSTLYEILDGSYIPHAEYTYNLFRALSWKDPEGNLLDPNADADTNNDLWVTMDEVNDLSVTKIQQKIFT